MVARGRYHLLHIGDRLSERLLDEDVLAGLETPARQRSMRGHGRGDRDRVDSRVREQLLDVGGRAHAREARCHPLELLGEGVADPCELGFRERVEVAREVRTPVAEADDGDPDRSTHATAPIQAYTLAGATGLPSEVVPRHFALALA